MAQFYWEPDPADEGLAPSNLTIVQPWAAFDQIFVGTEGTASESHSLHFNVAAAGGRQLAIFDAIGGVTVPEARDQEVWMKFIPNGSGNNTFAPLRCDRGTSAAGATGYARVGLARSDGRAEIQRYVGGTATLLASNASLDQGFDVYGLRARIEDDGTDARVRLKVWLWDDGQPDGGEPVAWDMDHTDTSPIDAAGAVGFFVFDGTTSFDGRVVKWGYGSDGDSAPTGPVVSEPALQSATVDADTLTLTYDEQLDEASVPATGDFSVDGTSSGVVSVSSVDVTGTDVTLTLGSAVEAGETVALDYTPGVNPIQDGSGNDAAGLTDEPVTNNTAVPGLTGDFDRGNLDLGNTLVADEGTSTPDYSIAVRIQTTAGTSDTWQHCYFEVSGVSGKTPTFSFVNPEQRRSNFPPGWQPRFSEDDGATWIDFANVTSGAAPGFSHDSAFSVDTVLVQSGPLVTVAEVKSHLSGLTQTHIHEPPSSAGANHVAATLTDQTDNQGRTIPGQGVLSYVITDMGAVPDDGHGKRSVLLISGLHAGEDIGEFTFQGTVNFLLGGSAEAQSLLKNFRFFVYPMANPMGRWGGHFRGQWDPADLTKDPNRDFSPQSIGTPEILESTQVLAAAMSDDLTGEGGRDYFEFLLDYHGNQVETFNEVYGMDDPNTDTYAAAVENYDTLATFDRNLPPDGCIRDHVSAGLPHREFFWGAFTTELVNHSTIPAQRARDYGEALIKALYDVWQAGEFNAESGVVFLRSDVVISLPSSNANESGVFDSGTEGDNRCLVVTVIVENVNSQEISNVTYGGQSLTKQVEANANPSDDFSENIEIWTLVNPPTGENTLQITNVSGGDLVAMAAVFTGVDQSSPVGNTASDSWLLGGSNGTVSIGKGFDNTVAYGVVEDRIETGPFTPAAGNKETEDGDTGGTSGSGTSFCSGLRYAGSGTVTVGATSSSNDQDGAVVAIELVAAAEPIIESASSPIAWALRTESEKALAWRIDATANTQAIAWAIRATDEHELAWAIRADSEHDSAWRILTAHEQATAWSVGGVVAHAMSIAWKVRADEVKVMAWRVGAHREAVIKIAWRVGSQWTTIESDPSDWIEV